MELSKQQEKNQMNFNEHLLRIRKASHQTQQALADYLGVERSAMSAEISKLIKSGQIDTNGAWFRLLK